MEESVDSAHITLLALSLLRLVVKFVFYNKGHEQTETAHKENTAGNHLTNTAKIVT